MAKKRSEPKRVREHRSPYRQRSGRRSDFALEQGDAYPNRCLGVDSKGIRCHKWLPLRSHVCAECQTRINALFLSKREEPVRTHVGGGELYLYQD